MPILLIITILKFCFNNQNVEGEEDCVERGDDIKTEEICSDVSLITGKLRSSNINDNSSSKDLE